MVATQADPVGKPAKSKKHRHGDQLQAPLAIDETVILLTLSLHHY